MYNMAKRVTIGTVILLLPTLAIWLSDWQWQPGGNNTWLKVFFWVTETVTAPWGILTSVLLCSWFLWCLRVRFKPAVGLFVVLGAVIVLGQGVKSLIKEQVQEPRPFVAWLEAEHHINNRLFYSLPRAERSELVRQQLQDQLIIPVWLSRHWQFETGFSFPSGHTVFAATWALLAVGLLWPRRHYKTVVLLMLWAQGVMASRLFLGMHWPQDLIAATLISGVLAAVACGLLQHGFGLLDIPQSEQKESEKRGHE
ncbi:phosphatidylglycerophosphatase B [Yersinia pseudotuberculosis]|uniref:phosphatidylglycerophosphatase B n=1 Tax=Yersinia pseudotuberculosis TaxID=633 RepID=UPI0005DF28F4|nr:phosphatidylglycerophosphatase B [Yersinia pseudotuberculosis]AXY32944.1 phosphatidylglycerophosphatase B [Yersinia pseudotuberculosis]AYX12809.1 phosphatidylglycerophosphatase B [Yersinia pseudotuberculosis]MBO1565167.1 phosphatidylglycerophosphatase B [Yersinia pseudotuberculosis]MBO1589263.1 phosphatidylglycerophosphatase B [Yersinia pseudotuberculosis]MBO1602128.1 phosphatidylglycerophosphatase B [Yersinia pseudotuberculosis]